MRYAIIEDDALSMRRLKTVCERLRPEWVLSFTARSVEETLLHLSLYSDIDLLICDIELNDGTIFNVFSQANVECPVIFITAYDEYLLEAFRHYGMAYILKPLDIKSLAEAFEKLERITRISRANVLKLLDKLEGSVGKQKFLKRILISIGDRFDSLNINEVLLFYNEGKYVYVITKDGKRVLTSFQSLHDLEERLDTDMFFRATRDTIITVESIKSVYKSFNGRLKILLSYYKEEIYVSNAKRNAFLSWYGANGNN